MFFRAHAFNPKISEQPPSNSAVTCIVRNGIIICDPELIRIIIVYNLEVLPDLPPGIQPVEVGSVAELERILMDITGISPSNASLVLDPIIGPFDPGTSRYDPGQDIDYSPPSQGVSASEDQHSPPPQTLLPNPPPPEPQVRTFEICWCIDPILQNFIDEIKPGWQATATGSLCATVTARFIPGQRFTEITSANAYYTGVTNLVFIHLTPRNEKANATIEPDGSLRVSASMDLEIFVGFKILDVVLGFSWTVHYEKTKVLSVP